jgi:hypothetical protein
MTAHDDRARDEQPAPTSTSTCCDGTGFADYAAVPCPNPTCPVPTEQPAPTARETCQDPACDREDLGEHHAVHLTARETAAEASRRVTRAIKYQRAAIKAGDTEEEAMRKLLHVFAPVEQQSARETAADELAEVERYLLGLAFHVPRVAHFLDAYDELGRERDAARAEAEQLRVQLTRTQALSSADPTAVRELRDENARLRARVAELEPIEQRWILGEEGS